MKTLSAGIVSSLLLAFAWGCGSGGKDAATSARAEERETRVKPPSSGAASSSAGGASVAPSAVGSVAPGSATLGFARCERRSHFGGAALPLSELTRIAGVIANGVCWGYFRNEVTAPKLAASLEACARAVQSTAFEVELSFGEDRSCTVEIAAGAWSGRTFVRALGTYATEVEVGGGGRAFGTGFKLDVLEIRADATVMMTSGQPCDALADPKKEPVGEITPGMREAWATTPVDARAWLCR